MVKSELKKYKIRSSYFFYQSNEAAFQGGLQAGSHFALNANGKDFL